jgi:hypothetical protein
MSQRVRVVIFEANQKVLEDPPAVLIDKVNWRDRNYLSYRRKAH